MRSMSSIGSEVTSILKGNRLVVFSKTYCPFCVSAKEALDKLGAKYQAIELNQISNGSEMQGEISSRSGIKTVSFLSILLLPLLVNRTLAGKINGSFSYGEVTSVFC